MPSKYLKLANSFEFLTNNFNENNRVFCTLDRDIHARLNRVDDPTYFRDFNCYPVSHLFISNQKIVGRFLIISTVRVRSSHVHSLRSKYIYEFKISKINTIESLCTKGSANKREIENFFTLKVPIKYSFVSPDTYRCSRFQIFLFFENKHVNIST